MLGIILSAVSTVLLVSFLILVYIVVKRLDINLIWELEYYLEVNNYQAPTKLVRSVNKAFASQEEKQKQLDLIHSCQANEKKFHETVQQEIYLLENKDLLERKKADNGRLVQDDEALLAKIKHNLRQVRPRLWANAQEFDDIGSQWVHGPWTLEFECESLADDMWEKHQLSCQRRLACCARRCGCCTKPRKGPAGQNQVLESDELSHCTVECGCCIRWRGLRLSDVFEGRGAKPPMYS